MSCETETSPTSDSTSDAALPASSRLTLAFRDAELEREYAVDRARRSVPQLRVAVAVMLIVSSLMGFVVFGLSESDGAISGFGRIPSSTLTSALVSVVVYGGFVVVIGSPRVWPRLQELTVACSMVWFALDVPMVGLLTLPYANMATLAALIVTFAILRLRFIFAAFVGLTILVSHTTVALLQHDLSGDAVNQLIVNISLSVAMTFVLMVASHQLEASDRSTFWLNRQTALRERALRAALAELTETESRLLEAEREAAQSRLVAGLLHEINNPTAVLRSSLQLWERGQQRLKAAEARHDAEEVQRLADQLRPVGQSIGASALRVTKALKGLETFVGLDAGHRVRVDVGDGVREAARLVHAQRGARVNVTVDAAAEPVGVHAHRYRLNQAWLQLLDNAARAVGPEGEVSAHVRVDGDRLVVEIEDDGPGMAEEVLASAFQVGFTDSDGRVRFHLGLPLSRRVVEEHGGELALSSTVGVGTRARVSLPLDDQSVESRRPLNT